MTDKNETRLEIVETLAREKQLLDAYGKSHVPMNEIQCRYYTTDPTLKALGWRVGLASEVMVEWWIRGNRRPDYGLFVGRNLSDILGGKVAPEVLVEVKSPARYVEKAEGDLRKYLLHLPDMAGRLAVWTNGEVWKLFPVGSQNRIQASEAVKVDLKSDLWGVANVLEEWLSRERFQAG